MTLIQELIEKLLQAQRSIDLYLMPSKIYKLATFIRDYEGKPGDRNYRNNNPGNVKYNPTGYLAKYGKVTKDKDGFAVFETYDLGWLYLCNMLLSWAKGAKGEWTILRVMKTYAPSSDNNDPVAYANYVSRELGIPSSTKLKELLK